MAEKEGKEVCDTPSAQYLLSGPDTPHTCWFLVGNPIDDVPELVSGCKLHLMAHSEPMRNMLHDSDIAEEGTKADPVKIVDVKPDTFRNFVKFINTNALPNLSLEEAVDLVYVSEKYIVEELKTNLGLYIVPLLNVDNVFVPLKQPECFQNEALKNCINKIVQQQTKELFTKEGFLDLTSAELLKHIVTQETLAVTELELWRAILRWAKHLADSEEGMILRETMSELLKFIRFCTLDMNDFCKEVVTTDILTASEVLSINKVAGGKPECDKSSYICYELTSRNITIGEIITVKGIRLDFIALGFTSWGNLTSSHLFITTKSKAVQLLSGELLAPSHSYRCVPENLKLQCNCTVTLARITDYGTNTSTEQPVQFTFVKNVLYNTNFILPFAENMKLLPYNKYKLELKFLAPLDVVYFKEHNKTVNSEGLVMSWEYGGSNNWPTSHLSWFEFHTL